ncbi:MAG: GtrA family protein [Candidatus Villigracilaceae bacterium]
MILTDSVERVRFFRFLVVGSIGAVVDFGVMNLLTQAFDFPLVLAGIISFVCAVLSNFIWNRYWTYPDSRSKPLGKQLAMFFVVNIAGVAIRIPILHFVEPPLENLFNQQHLAFGNFSAQFWAKNFTLAIAVGIVLLWNFFVNRYWTYNDVD